MAGTKNPLVNTVQDKFEYSKEMIEKVYRASKDLFYFAENFVYIVHPSKGKIQFSYQDRLFQKRLLETYLNSPRIAALAVRQCGKTTCTSIYVLWYAMFQPYKTCAILANKDDTAKSILNDIKTMYENLPKWLKVPCTEYNAHTITFSNGSKIFAAATSKNGLAGESVSFLYMDEVALIEPPTLAFEFWRANLPTVSHGEKIIVTSTPRGIGNLFHTIWKEALEKKNGFVPIRVDYWEVPEYSITGWKEEMIKSLGGVIPFNSEYGNQFIGSQSTIIPAEVLKNFKSKEPIFKQDTLGGEERVWEIHDPKSSYIATVDISLGSGNDYSVFQIFKMSWRRPTKEDHQEYAKKSNDCPEAIITKLEQVYLFRSNMTSIPNLCDHVFATLPKWGKPYFLIENNGIAQSFVDKMTEEYYYENIYTHEDSPVPGINSNFQTKSAMVDALRKYCEAGKVVLNDAETINEMMTYIEKRSTAGHRRFQAEDGSYDDTVVSTGWACYLADTLWIQDVLTFSV